MNDEKDKELLAWSKEYEDFISSGSRQPSERLSRGVLSQIGEKLHPSAWLVFLKLGAVHLVASLLTLSLCPQFGLGLAGTDSALYKMFLKLGPTGCMVACGAFFMSLTLILASLILKPEEIRSLREHRVVQVGALGLISSVIFICLGAEVHLQYLTAWFAGLMLFGTLSLEIGWKSRKLLASR